MYRGWGVSLRFATETRTSAHTAVRAYAARKEEKEGKERSALGRLRSGKGRGHRTEDSRGRESGKGVIKSKVLSQQGSRHFAVACSAREMTSAKMADLRGAARQVLHRCRACVHPTRTGALDRRNDIGEDTGQIEWLEEQTRRMARENVRTEGEEGNCRIISSLDPAIENLFLFFCFSFNEILRTHFFALLSRSWTLRNAR